MTQEDKELLLKDLSARLPYGVMIQIPELFCPQRKVIEKLVTIDDLWHFNDDGIYIENVKPYLRPMSSIAELITAKEWSSLGGIDLIDWYNANHIDYRGLIEKGLALEAPKDMYHIKTGIV